jgi:phasin family protein
MSKVAEQFLKPSKIAEEMVSQLKALAVKGVDVDAVMASQRKNIEALANASRSTLDGAHAVGKRQAEILEETMTETAQALETLAKSASPTDLAARQAELMKDGFGKALGHMRELAETVRKAQQGAVDAIGNRVTQSLDELRHTAAMSDGAAATKPATATTAGH